MQKTIIVATTESIIERREYWENKRAEEFKKEDVDRDLGYLFTCQGHIDALTGILNVFTVEIK